MANHSNPPAGFLSRATDPSWQNQLRACVQLYLSSAANAKLERELDALLQRSEQELLDYLLAGGPPSPTERQRAEHFLDRAQCELLSSHVDVQQLLAKAAHATNTPLVTGTNELLSPTLGRP